MGGGHFSPKPQTGDTATEQSTDSPQENTASTETPNTSRGSDGASATAVSNTLNGGERSGIEKRVEGELNDPVEYDLFESAAYEDRGYSQEYAARIRNMSSEELREEFNERIANNNIDRDDSGSAIRDVAGFITDALGISNSNINKKGPAVRDSTRFIGGVLVSREDTDFTAEDLFDGTQDGIDSAVDNIDGKEHDKDEILGEMTEVFEHVDEYVAGQVAAEINEVKIVDMGEDTGGRMGSGAIRFNPDDLGRGSQPNTGVNMERDFDEFARIESLNENITAYDLFAHEMAHAFHQSLGLTRTERQAPHKKDIPPDELTLNPTLEDSATSEVGSFPRREALAERFKEHADNMVATLKADGEELSELDSVVKPIQDYQMCDFSEMTAAGFETYMSDVVLATNKQREIVETFDEFITGDGWTETTVDNIADHGVSHNHRQKSDIHISARDARQRVQERDEVESKQNYGQVALFEFNEEIAPGRDYAAGYVDKVTENEVTFSYLGDKITVDRDNIEGVKERKEMKEQGIS